MNVPAVKVLNMLGTERGARALRSLGLTVKREDENLSLALGGCQRRLHPARDRRCLRGSRGRRKICTSLLYPENRGRKQDSALRAFRRARPRLFGRYGSAYDRHDADCSKRRNSEKTFRSSLSRRRKDRNKRGTTPATRAHGRSPARHFIRSESGWGTPTIL